MSKKLFLVVGLVMVFSMVLAACGGGGSSSSGSTSASITMSDFSFEPKEITVPAGKEVSVTLTNKGSVEHDWVVMAKPVTPPFDANAEANVLFTQKVAAGASQVVKFTAPAAAGEYEIVCSIPGHMEAGMVGKLIVTAP